MCLADCQALGGAVCLRTLYTEYHSALSRVYKQCMWLGPSPDI